MTLKIISRAAGALSLVYGAGCIPLTVGSTAQPVPVGTTVQTTSVYVVPSSFDDTLNNRSYPRYGVDPEIRFGLDERSDIGVRFPSFSGVVANDKHRLNGLPGGPGFALAVLPDGAIEN